MSAFAGGASDGAFGPGGASPDIIAHTLIVAAAGCASASITGGKCADAAVTVALANIYNAWGGQAERASVPFYTGAVVQDAEALYYFEALSRYDPQSWRSHFYQVIGDHVFSSFEEAVSWLRTNPGPTNHNSPSHPDGFVGGKSSKLDFWGTITTYLNPDTGSVFNVTEKHHVLHPGTVMRQVVEMGGGYRILTTGTGMGLPYSSLGAEWTWWGKKW